MANWIERFQNVLARAEAIAEAKDNALDAIRAMKLAGINRDEAFLRIAADLVNSGLVSYAALYQTYLDEVYGVEEKST